MTSTTRRGAVIAACLTAMLPAPASAAAAPALELDGACYTPGMRIGVHGSGFTPSGGLDIDLELDGSIHGYSGAADAAGLTDGTIPLPEFVAPRTTAGLTFTDLATGTVATAPFTASQWAVSVSGWGERTATGRPGRRARVTALGWVGTESTTLYAHYVKSGRLAKTVRVGRLTGECGDLTASMRQFPFRARQGATYAVYFDTARAWPNSDAWIRFPRVRAGGARRAIRGLHSGRAGR